MAEKNRTGMDLLGSARRVQCERCDACDLRVEIGAYLKRAKHGEPRIEAHP